MSPKVNFSIFPFLLVFLFLQTLALSAEDVNLGPLFYKNNKTFSKKDYDILGPFITFKKSPESSEFGLRPLFYKANNTKKNISELDFLYPISSYKRVGTSTLTQVFIHIIRFEAQKLETGFVNKEFDFFPFIFYRNYEDKEQNHFAFFPFFGNLKNKFSKDEIDFFLFPIYLKSKSEGDITKSIVWPFLSFYSGGHRGFRIWPIWGKRVRERDQLDQRFALWPLYVRSEKVFYGEKTYSRSFLPFYSESKFLGVKRKSYFWPFINHLVNDKIGFERWDTPWPFVNFTKGPETQTRIFPFYSRSMNQENDKEGFILWPLYRYSKVKLGDHTRDKKSFLLFLYSDEKLIPVDKGGKSGRKIDLFPFFSYRKGNNGESSFHVFTLFEPFIRSNERLYRNYSSFWRIFEWKRTADNETYSSLFWNLYTMYSGNNSKVVEIRPIFPLFSYSRVEENLSLSLFGGLIGYKEGRYFKLFYIPINLGD